MTSEHRPAHAPLPHDGAAPVTVEAPARLHLGFLDLHGGLKRRFGSLGLAIDGLATRLSMRRAPGPDDLVQGFEAERVRRLLPALRAMFDLPPLAIAVEAAIPPHAGLGSGTQLALALTAAAARLFGQEVGLAGLARRVERGARSGIGLGTFVQGGLILDGGKGVDDAPPPVIARLPFPEAWRVLLLSDGGRQGLSGSAEVQAFAELPPFPAEAAGDLCRHAVMAFLPGVATADLSLAGPAIGHIQRVVGDHFAGAQGGRFTSPAVAAALAELEEGGIAGVGQSSWGPTGFALMASEGEALAWRDRLAGRHPALALTIHAGRNSGASLAGP